MIGRIRMPTAALATQACNTSSHTHEEEDPQNTEGTPLLNVFPALLLKDRLQIDDSRLDKGTEQKEKQSADGDRQQKGKQDFDSTRGAIVIEEQTRGKSKLRNEQRCRLECIQGVVGLIVGLTGDVDIDRKRKHTDSQDPLDIRSQRIGV